MFSRSCVAVANQLKGTSEETKNSLIVRQRKKRERGKPHILSASVPEVLNLFGIKIMWPFVRPQKGSKKSLKFYISIHVLVGLGALIHW